MTKWQKRTRLVIAIGAVAFAIVVVFALKRREPQPQNLPSLRADPDAVVEVTGGRIERFKLSRQDVSVEYERQFTYANGSTKLINVTISADGRASSRSFRVTGKDADVGQNESTIRLNGDVRIAASDGLAARTEHASYSGENGLIRAPGPVDFSLGRTTGSGIGMTYDTARDLLVILDRAVVHFAPDEVGGGAEVASGAATFARGERRVRFDRNVRLQRNRQTVEGDSAVLYLTDDERQIRLLEVRGRSRITMDQPAAGDLKELSARDIDLKYGADGLALEHVVLMGDARIVLAGSASAAGRRIAASAIDVSLAPDGATPVSLTARDAVVLTLPAGGRLPERSIRSAAMDAKGEASRGLDAAQFTGNVEFRERGVDLDRVARSGTLDVTLQPGMADIEDAIFSWRVRFFEDGSELPGDDQCAPGRSLRLRMCAASIRYDLAKGILELTSSDPASARPRVVNDRIAIDATRINVSLGGPDVKARGAVKSVVQPVPRTDTAGTVLSATRLPSMFKQDQPIIITADALDYNTTVSHAIYTGNAQLWQQNTSIKGAFVALDDKSGDLTAGGGVTTVTTRKAIDKNRKGERIRSIATASDFRYEEHGRRATYTGNARVNSSVGDITAEKIELYLKAAGSGGAWTDDLERAEAYESVTFRESNRTMTGTRLTYTTADERYVVTGAPVKVLDECHGETIGRTLTYLKSAGMITIDGSEQTRTQTKGSGQCP